MRCENKDEFKVRTRNEDLDPTSVKCILDIGGANLASLIFSYFEEV